jgi:hypothetical protein
MRPHNLHLFPHLHIAILHSESEGKIKAISTEEFGRLIAERKIGLSIGELRENMMRVPKEDLIPSSKRPKFMLNVFPANIGPDQG